MGRRALFALLRDFADDTSSGSTFTGRGRLFIMVDDPAMFSGRVSVGSDWPLDADAASLQLENPGIVMDDPWEGFSDAELRAIRDRDLIYRTRRQTRPAQRAA